jgi:hypothetical protein
VRESYAEVKQARRKMHSAPGAIAAKTKLRRNVLEAIGAERCHVLDLYSGAGEMFRSVWNEAASYVGCDVEWFRDGRLVYVADNRRLIRAIDLAPYTVFDLDAYGAPWELFIMLTHRRKLLPGELVGVILTDGAGLRLRVAQTGGFGKAFAHAAGVSKDFCGAWELRHELTLTALRRAQDLLGGVIVRSWQAQGRKGAQTLYTSVVYRGEGSTSPAEGV